MIKEALKKIIELIEMRVKDRMTGHMDIVSGDLKLY